MQILSSLHMRQMDQFTIENEPVLSIDLMERAAQKCFEWISGNVAATSMFHVFCGPGNNGGDGLALARMLFLEGYQLKVSVLSSNKIAGPDYSINLNRLKEFKNLELETLTEVSILPQIDSDCIVIDAIFGTGFNKVTTGLNAKIIRQINCSGASVISIDIPSGMHSDETSLFTGNEIIIATNTLTFQYLKPAFMVVENAPFAGRIHVLNIGLLSNGLEKLRIENFLIDIDLIQSIYKPKSAFSNKGTFGHSLLISGDAGKMGACILAANGYLKSGAGLLTLLVPQNEIPIVQTAIPEAMALGYNMASLLLPPLDKYAVIAMGPGLGTGDSAKEILNQLLNNPKIALVLDADALNILAINRDWLNCLPEGTIITPHPGEFKRLTGGWANDFEKLQLQKKLATNQKIFVILKGKNTSVACPDGTMWFNPTGNPGMAKGGSGDILTGLLLGLRSSGYSPFDACILGVWLHGHAGDIAALKLTEEAMHATDIINHLSHAWKTIIDYRK